MYKLASFLFANIENSLDLIYNFVMKVYRFLCKQELCQILNGDIKQTGHVFNGTVFPNNHKYKHNEKYLHFFKNLKDLKYIQRACGGLYGGYLCKFDIPLHVLLPRTGKGYYRMISSGYDDFGDTEIVKEYAVESKKMETKYLVDFVFDSQCSMTPEQIELEFERNKQYGLAFDLKNENQESKKKETEEIVESEKSF